MVWGGFRIDFSTFRLFAPRWTFRFFDFSTFRLFWRFAGPARAASPGSPGASPRESFRTASGFRRLPRAGVFALRLPGVFAWCRASPGLPPGREFSHGVGPPWGFSHGVGLSRARIFAWCRASGSFRMVYGLPWPPKARVFAWCRRFSHGVGPPRASQGESFAWCRASGSFRMV